MEEIEKTLLQNIIRYHLLENRYYNRHATKNN